MPATFDDSMGVDITVAVCNDIFESYRSRVLVGMFSIHLRSASWLVASRFGGPFIPPEPVLPAQMSCIAGRREYVADDDIDRRNIAYNVMRTVFSSELIGGEAEEDDDDEEE